MAAYAVAEVMDVVGVLTRDPRKGHRARLEQTRLLGLRVLWARVPVTDGMRERKRRRRIARGAEALYREGVRRVLVESGFPDWETLRSAGLRPVDPEPFCQAIAPPLALAALAQAALSPAQATVSLSAPRMNRALFRAAEALCPQVRYLEIDVPEGGKELAGWLREEFGAAVLLPGGGPRPDVSLCFGPGEAAGKQVLRLYGPEPDLAGLRPLPAEEALPAELDGLPLVALLWETGLLRAGQLRFLPP